MRDVLLQYFIFHVHHSKLNETSDRKIRNALTLKRGEIPLDTIRFLAYSVSCTKVPVNSTQERENVCKDKVSKQNYSIAILIFL